MVIFNQNYSQWSDDPKERRQMAREILGRDIVLAHDGWLKRARGMLFEGERAKRPTTEQKKVEGWIAQLKPEDREAALSFVRDIADGIVFSILVALDGDVAGSWIAPTRTKYRLVLEIYETDESYMSREPTEVIRLDSKKEYDFHEEWPGWVERYSEFKSIF